MSGTKRPNYYELLKLNPSVQDPTIVKAKIDEAEVGWQRRAASDNTFRVYLEMLPDIRHVLLTAATRAKEAEEARRRLEAEWNGRVAFFRTQGGYNELQLRKLTNAFKWAFSEAEIGSRLSRAGIKPQDALTAGPAVLALPTDSVLARMNAGLQVLGYATVYDLLSDGQTWTRGATPMAAVTPRTSASLLEKRAREIQSAILARSLTNAKATAAKDLCSLCFSELFRDEQSKRALDTYLRVAPLAREIGDEVDYLRTGDVVQRATIDGWLKRADQLHVPTAMARSYIETLATAGKWTVLPVAPAPPKPPPPPPAPPQPPPSPPAPSPVPPPARRTRRDFVIGGGIFASGVFLGTRFASGGDKTVPSVAQVAPTATSALFPTRMPTSTPTPMPTQTLTPTQTPTPNSTATAKDLLPTENPEQIQASEPASTAMSGDQYPALTGEQNDTKTFTADDWIGENNRRLDATFYGRKCVVISDIEPRASLSFALDRPPYAGATLIVLGLDDEMQGSPAVKVAFNGTSVFEGPSPFMDAYGAGASSVRNSWIEKSISIPQQLLKRSNEVEFILTESIGGYSSHRYVMLSDAKLNVIVTPSQSSAHPTVVPTQETTINIVLGDLYFNPKAFTIPAETDVTIILANHGALPHSFVLEGQENGGALVNPGESVTITLNCRRGTYQFYCDEPGHRPAGMHGTLTVT